MPVFPTPAQFQYHLPLNPRQHPKLRLTLPHQLSPAVDTLRKGDGWIFQSFTLPYGKFCIGGVHIDVLKTYKRSSVNSFERVHKI